VERLSSKKYRLMAFLKGVVSVAKIHSTAIVDAKAKIAENVEIGPFCMVGAKVRIGEGTKLLKYCNVEGHTEIGENNTLYPFVSLGTMPQDFAYEEYVSYLKIGDGNIFKEGFTANPGTGEHAETVIGNNCLFMANSHVGHNCKVGNNIILANCSALSGYTEVGDFTIISGLVGTHQFIRIGKHVMISGGSVFSMDIPPYAIAEGRNGAIKTANIIGLKRKGFSKEAIKAIRAMYKIFFKSGLNVSNALARIENELEMIPEVKEFVDFVKSSKRGVLHGRSVNRRS
jgi:UDP-N-acetylglucosamine acyltransferase